jgi:hypothetical protein
MLSSYPVKCPHEDCGWAGSEVPSPAQGGAGSEIASGRRAWFRCPRCGRDWEVLMEDDKVTVLPGFEHGG